MNTPLFEIGSACDVGRKRAGKPNQDSVGVVWPPPDAAERHPLLIVADGMGGHRGGEIASRIVVETITQRYLAAPPGEDVLAALADYVREAHRAVRQRAAGEDALQAMGSTVALALPTEERVYIANVGDSRVYLFRGRETIQLSEDQSWVAAQQRAGLLTAEEARAHPRRSRLTMSISAKRPTIEVYTAAVALETEDVLVLCSDGLWSVVPLPIIQAVVYEMPPQQAAGKLVTLANLAQGPDNISVIIARRAGAPLRSVFADEDETGPGI